MRVFFFVHFKPNLRKPESYTRDVPPKYFNNIPPGISKSRGLSRARARDFNLGATSTRKLVRTSGAGRPAETTVLAATFGTRNDARVRNLRKGQRHEYAENEWDDTEADRSVHKPSIRSSLPSGTIIVYMYVFRISLSKTFIFFDYDYSSKRELRAPGNFVTY